MSTSVGAPVERSEDAHHAAAGVEQGHRREPDRAVGDLHAVGPQPGVVDDAAVAQDGTLREAGGAAGVLDLHRVVGVHHGELDVAVGRRQELDELVEAQHLAQLGQLGADRRRRGPPDGLPRTSGTRNTPAARD